MPPSHFAPASRIFPEDFVVVSGCRRIEVEHVSGDYRVACLVDLSLLNKVNK